MGLHTSSTSDQTMLSMSHALSAGQAGVLRRTCSCGQHTASGTECSECSKRRLSLRRTSAPQGTHVRPKLAVGPADDPLEREADRVADAVVASRDMPMGLGLSTWPRIQRIPCPGPGGEVREEEKEAAPATTESAPVANERTEEEEPTLQGISDRVLDAQATSGRPLPAAVRRDMGERMGADFSRVRIHTDSEAVGLSSALGAHAFTYGSHIFFNQGKFDPGSRQGQHVLAHELAHTLQQNGQTIRRLSVSAVGALAKGPCGRYRKRWDFTLGAPASADGYIVQQVDFYEDIMTCPSLGQCPVNPTLTFWEAWPVAKGATVHSMHSAAGYTDQSAYPGKSGKPGYVGAFGEIKFYLKSVTGDLGSFNTAPATARGGWGPGSVSQSGSLPSTSTRPSWWSSSPTEGPATRSAYAGWRCCGDASDYNTIVATP